MRRLRHDKDAAAVALGRRGGLRGGPARAARLSAEERREIARRAARARWGAAPAAASPSRGAGGGSSTALRILGAAREELQRRGPAAARMDRIARRARVNKRMLYHYFGSKDGLVREVFQRNALHLAELDRRAPSDAGEALVFWRDLLLARHGWLRLVLWESLEGSGALASAPEQAELWRASVDDLRRTLARRRSRLDAAQLQLALVAIVLMPAALPQLARLIAGGDPASPAFRAAQAEFLKRLAPLLDLAPA